MHVISWGRWTSQGKPIRLSGFPAAFPLPTAHLLAGPGVGVGERHAARLGHRKGHILTALAADRTPPVHACVRRISDGATAIILRAEEIVVEPDGCGFRLEVTDFRSLRGRAKAPKARDEVEIVATEAILTLALKAMDDTADRAALADLVQELGWRHPFVESTFGRQGRRRYLRRRGSSARPTRAWARAVAAALLFAEWDAVMWPVVRRRFEKGGGWGPSPLRDALLAMYGQLGRDRRVDEATGDALDRLASLYSLERRRGAHAEGVIGYRRAEDESDGALRARLRELLGARFDEHITTRVIGMSPGAVSVQRDPNDPTRLTAVGLWPEEPVLMGTLEMGETVVYEPGGDARVLVRQDGSVDVYTRTDGAVASMAPGEITSPGSTAADTV